MTGLSVVWRQVEHCRCCCVRKVKPLTDIVPCVYMFCDTAVLILGADRIQSDHCEVVHFSGSNMDFRVFQMTVVTILALATIMQTQKLERDKATCTASVATKGETAVVTCHYPLVVKQPGEIVSVSMERYPFTSSNTGSPRYGYVLECTWHETFTCTLNKEEHRVEGKDVVITIRNVTEDSQGHYLCKMMVKDGPNIHGEACELRLSGEIPPGPWPRTTDPAMDQPIIRNNDTGSDRGLGADFVAAIVVCGSVLVVMVTAVFVCRKRKRRRNRPASKPVDETVESCLSEAWLMPGCTVEGNMEHSPVMECQTTTESLWHHLDLPRGNGLLPQRDHAHPARSGAQGQGNNDDIDQSQDISNRPENKVPKLVNLYNERDGARQRDCVSTYRVRLQDTSDCPKDKVRNLANVYNEKEARQQGSVSTSPVRAWKETKETEKTHGEEKKEDEENETGGRQESKQDEKEKEGEENETKERQEEKQEEEKEGEENKTKERQEEKQEEEKEKEGEENETKERQEKKQDEEEKEGEENETEERQEEKPNEEEKEDEENKTEEKKQDEKKKDEENEKYREDDDGENKGNEEEEVEDAVEREGGGAESLPLLDASNTHTVVR